jgi:Flp pilus assembly protein TadD
MYRRFSAVLLLGFLVSAPAWLQTLTFEITPGADIPLGPNMADGTRRYTFGGGSGLALDVALPFAPAMFAEGALAVEVIGVNAPSTVMTLLSLGAGAGAVYAPIPQLSLKASAGAGYGLGLLGGTTGGAPYIQAGASAAFRFTPAFSLGAGASYKHYFGLYNGLGVFLGGSLQLGGSKRARVEFKDIMLNPVFPVFQTYYNLHPIGEVLIRNGEGGPVRNISVSFLVPQFMDKPKLCATFDSMKAGEQETVQLYGLFTDRILKVTEGTEAAAEIIVEYRFMNEDRSASRSGTLQINNRNAMTWDDDRKAASFVTFRDPGVNKFSKAVGGMAREQGSSSINVGFRQAMAIFEALGLYGMNYVIDPKSSYSEASHNKLLVDTLNFPVQTLVYKAGDCDDLSILYCALLQSIGIDTAFITVPGHIFMAFSLGISPDEARKVFSRPEDLISRESLAWVPVEITMVRDGFLDAWQEGAKEWRENTVRGVSQFHPMSACWELYAPTGIESDESMVALPKSDAILARYGAALQMFVTREIDEAVTGLRESIRSSNNDPKLVNRLGVLYGKYGVLDKAEAEFKKAASARYAPAVVNLGNLCFLGRDFGQASTYFRRALALDKNSTAAVVGLAKAAFELGDTVSLKSVYAQLQTLDPEYAKKLSYLVSSEPSEGTRAGTAAGRESVSWSD